MKTYKLNQTVTIHTSRLSNLKKKKCMCTCVCAFGAPEGGVKSLQATCYRCRELTGLTIGFSARASHSLNDWAISQAPDICKSMFVAAEGTAICVFWMCGTAVGKWIVPFPTVIRSPIGWYLPLTPANGRLSQEVWQVNLDHIARVYLRKTRQTNDQVARALKHYQDR